MKKEMKFFLEKIKKKIKKNNLKNNKKLWKMFLWKKLPHFWNKTNIFKKPDVKRVAIYRPEGAKNDKGPEGAPARSRAPEGP